VSVITVDKSEQFNNDNLLYTGVAVTDYPTNNRLYVTNYISREVEVYDGQWRRVPTASGAFRYPGQPDDMHAWNIQYFRSGPAGEGRLWVAYSLGESPWEQNPLQGEVAEFDLEGNFIQKLKTSLDTDPMADSELRAPWGFAFAPDNFGPLSGALLIANFGDGTIAGYNHRTGEFIDFMRGRNGQPLEVDGVWGLLFGNGVALGDTYALYYAAGPRSEFDGTFGSLRWVGGCFPDVNSDGVLNDRDLALFDTLYDNEDVRADLNNDGEWTFDDRQAFVLLYNSGC
jgi:uncharacterized protein (TIGR03118 family)